MKVQTSTRIGRADDIYERLIALHEGRSEAESMRLNARLILLLINQIGDSEAVLDVIAQAAATDDQKDRHR